MIERTKSYKRAFAFAIASLVVAAWLWIPIYRAYSDGRLADANLSVVLAMLSEISLQIFLFYRFAAALRLLSKYTDRLDFLFYEDKKGSLALTVVSILWGLFSLGMAALSTLDALFPGGTMLNPLGKLNPVAAFFSGIMTMISPFVFLGLAGWFAVTAAKAIWRVTAPSDGRDRLPTNDFEAVPLSDEERQSDEWDGWKDNRG